MGYFVLQSGTLGGRGGSVALWLTYDGQKHGRPVSGAPQILASGSAVGDGVSAPVSPAFDAPTNSIVIMFVNGESPTGNAVSSPAWVGGTPAGASSFVLKASGSYNDGWNQYSEVWVAEVSSSVTNAQVWAPISVVPGGGQFGLGFYVVGATTQSLGSVGLPNPYYPGGANRFSTDITSLGADGLILACVSSEDYYAGNPPTPLAGTTIDIIRQNGGNQDFVFCHTVTTGSGDISIGVTPLGPVTYQRSIAIEIKTALGGPPTVGVGQAAAGNNYLSRNTNLPTYDSCTVCGHFFYAGQTGDYQVLASYLDSSNYTFLGVNNVTDVSYAYSLNTGVVNGPTLVSGTWYFWAMTQNAGVYNAYLVPSNQTITVATMANLSYNAGNPAQRHYLMEYSGGGTTKGYVARVRAWSSVLTIAELNAERMSATVVKAGSAWNAQLDSLSNLDGYAITGTLSTGP